MSQLFEDKKDFNEDISNWDVSKVTNMSCMFCKAKLFNGDLSSWNVSNAEDGYMFIRLFLFIFLLHFHFLYPTHLYQTLLYRLSVLFYFFVAPQKTQITETKTKTKATIKQKQENKNNKQTRRKKVNLN